MRSLLLTILLQTTFLIHISGQDRDFRHKIISLNSIDTTNRITFAVDGGIIIINKNQYLNKFKGTKDLKVGAYLDFIKETNSPKICLVEDTVQIKRHCNDFVSPEIYNQSRSLLIYYVSEIVLKGDCIIIPYNGIEKIRKIRVIQKYYKEAMGSRYMTFFLRKKKIELFEIITAYGE